MTQTAKNNFLSIFLIIALNLLVYANSMKAPFQFDDVWYIKNNKNITEPLHDFDKFRSTYLLRGLVRLSYAVNYVIGKLDTFGYHIFNLLVHILTAILFFIVLRHIGANHNWNLPLIAALLFSLHPIQIESVTYLMGRAGLMAALFYLLAFYFLIYFDRYLFTNWIKSIIFFAFILISFLLGLGSKLTIITFPIILILYIFIKNINNKDLLNIVRKYKWLLCGVFLVISLVATYKCLGGAQLLIISGGQGLNRYDRLGYFITEAQAFYLFYLRLLFFPINQNINPDFPFMPSSGIAAIFLILTLLGFIYFLKNIRKSPLIFFSASWMLIALAPTSSIIPLLDLVAEHRFYIPSMGFFLLISILLIKAKTFPAFMKTISVISVLIIFSLLTVQRNGIWVDEVSLWTDAVKKSPNHRRSHHNAGRSYYNAKMPLKAVEAYKKANKIDNSYYETHYNLGVLYYEMGDKEKALEEFIITLRLKNDLPEAYINLAAIYMGKLEYEKAIVSYMEAIKADRNCVVCYFNIANIYFNNIKDYKKAKFYLKQTLRIDPNHEQKRAIQLTIDSLKDY